MIKIFDFEDSFTLNIFSDLKHLCEIEIIPLEKMQESLLKLLSSDEHQVIILGPGPGHPSQYKEIYPIINKLLSKRNIFVFGICLGHQIILESLGCHCSHCDYPMHGQVVQLSNTKALSFILNTSKPLKVQRYNSLCVKESELKHLDYNKSYDFYTHGDEIMIFKGENLLTYQFHPESIGSEDQDILYSALKQFLLN